MVPHDLEGMDDDEPMGPTVSPMVETTHIHGIRPIPNLVIVTDKTPNDPGRDAKVLESILSTILPDKTLLLLFYYLSQTINNMATNSMVREQQPPKKAGGFASGVDFIKEVNENKDKDVKDKKLRKRRVVEQEVIIAPPTSGVLV